MASSVVNASVSNKDLCMAKGFPSFTDVSVLA